MNFDRLGVAIGRSVDQWLRCSNSRLVQLVLVFRSVQHAVIRINQFISLVVCVALCSHIIAATASAQGYFRQPTLHHETLVFVAEGDLWTVPLSGGTASRLTTHPDAELLPAFSPDGNQIAYVAHYDGAEDVYVMSASGGAARRITYDASQISHVGWMPDGRVLVGTSAHADLPGKQLVAIDISSPDGTVSRTRIPLAQAADGEYTADGNTIVFTRLAFQGSHTRRYQGGTVQQLWSYRDGTEEAIPLTSDFKGTSRTPRLANGRIYFASDRDGVMNLWSMKLDGSDLRQHTRFTDYEIGTPTLSQGNAVFQQGADLWRLNLETGKQQRVPITLRSDLDQTRDKWVHNPFDYLTDVHINTTGDRVALVSRGRVFVSPLKEGRFVEPAATPGVRYRDARWHSDGRSLISLSDETGEVEIWRIPADGLGKAEPLTTDGRVLRTSAIPSPDGRYVAHTDKNQRLMLLSLEPRTSVVLAENPVDDYDAPVWTADSKWLVYVEAGQNQLRQIKLYSIATEKTTVLTTSRFDSFAPAFSPDGKWLYFFSDRNLKTAVGSPWGTYQPEPFHHQKTRCYQIALGNEARSPFQLPTELEPQSDGSKAAETDAAGKERKEIELKIELEGIEQRLFPVPTPPGQLSSLKVNDRALFWLQHPIGVADSSLLYGMPISRESPVAKVIAEGVRSFELSGDGKKLLVVRKDELHVVDANPEPMDPKKGLVDLSQWRFVVKPRDEWRQMFNDAWRLERDYFYDRNMHGLDWIAIRKKYEPLLPRVTDRLELDDVISQMVAELSALHIFVRPGDVRKGRDDIEPGRLGATFVRDPAKGGYRVEHVYRHDPDEPDRAGPFARPDSRVVVGEILISIDGKPTLSMTDLGEALRHKGERQTLLEVRNPQGETRKIVTRPLTEKGEAELRYHEWEFTRRQQVEQLSQGEFGYVHLRAMGANDYVAWAQGFYPVFNRKGLVIDVRNNRGGNIDSWIISRLLRKPWFFWNQRVGRSNNWNMQNAFRGHVVVLCNEQTASDGEAFCEAIKRLKIGTVIGTRTWGGEIWLTQSNRLLDNGIATSAEFGVFDRNGQWLIEGHGVDPDVVVDNLPHATFQGTDAQLNAAISHLKKRLEEDPITLPEVPPFPKVMPNQAK